jgi:hypothetical protein
MSATGRETAEVAVVSATGNLTFSTLPTPKNSVVVSTGNPSKAPTALRSDAIFLHFHQFLTKVHSIKILKRWQHYISKTNLITSMEFVGFVSV